MNNFLFNQSQNTVKVEWWRHQCYSRSNIIKRLTPAEIHDQHDPTTQKQMENTSHVVSTAYATNMLQLSFYLALKHHNNHNPNLILPGSNRKDEDSLTSDATIHPSEATIIMNW